MPAPRIRMIIPYFPEPVIHAGALPIPAFGVTAAAAVSASLWTVLRRASKLSISVEEIFRMWFYMYIGAMAGAHVYKIVVDDYSSFLVDPSMLFHYHGMSSAGAFSGGLLCGWIWCRYKRLGGFEILRRA